MGWESTMQALKYGHGTDGTVEESLRTSPDHQLTIFAAIHQIASEILAGEYVPDENARARIAYWAQRYNITFKMRNKPMDKTTEESLMDEIYTGMETTKYMWELLSEILSDQQEKLPDPLNKAIYALCDGVAIITEKKPRVL